MTFFLEGLSKNQYLKRMIEKNVKLCVKNMAGFLNTFDQKTQGRLHFFFIKPRYYEGKMNVICSVHHLVTLQLDCVAHSYKFPHFDAWL